MLPQTTDFGVTPDEARALHKKQHESDSKMVCLGLSGGCMMLSPVLWQLRFHVIAGKAEYIIDVSYLSSKESPRSRHANS